MRLLLIDDNKGMRTSWAALLHEAGHRVVVRRDHRSLAPESAHGMHFDLAIIDRRLEREEDDADVSGQEYAVRLCSLGTPTIMLTAHVPEGYGVFGLLRRGSLTGVVKKTIDPKVFLDWIERYGKGEQFPNGIANLTWRKVADRTGVEELLRILAPPCASEIEIKGISGGQSGAAVAYAKISYGDGSIPEELAIKYGPKPIIRSERLRFDRLVGPLPDGVAAQLRWRTELGDRAAIAYSWVSDSIENAKPLGPATKSVDWPRRRTAVGRLFSTSLNRWHEGYRNGSYMTDPQPLIDHYVGRGGLWYVDKGSLENMSIPCPEVDLPEQVVQGRGIWDFGRLGGRLPDPVAWATEIGNRLHLTRLCPCHGDMHVRNVFVLPDDSPRLIDFGRTDLGHVFRDFAALEASIRLTCVPDTDPAVLRQAEDYVSDIEGLGQYIDYRGITGSDDLKEAVRMTLRIRRAALDASGDGTPSAYLEYLFAVVLHMLRYASGVADEIPRKKLAKRLPSIVWHAMYGAARAARRASELRA